MNYSNPYPPLQKKKEFQNEQVFCTFCVPYNSSHSFHKGVPKNCVACMKVQTGVYFISPYVYGLLSVKYIILLVNAFDNLKKMSLQ